MLYKKSNFYNQKKNNKKTQMKIFKTTSSVDLYTMRNLFTSPHSKRGMGQAAGPLAPPPRTRSALNFEGTTQREAWSQNFPGGVID